MRKRINQIDLKTQLWVRHQVVEDAYNSLHSIKPRIEKATDKKAFKLSMNDKDVILQEVIERGLTKVAFLTYNGETIAFKSVLDAEKAANKILTGD
jgi:hypothetical protein